MIAKWKRAWNSIKILEDVFTLTHARNGSTETNHEIVFAIRRRVAEALEIEQDTPLAGTTVTSRVNFLEKWRRVWAWKSKHV